MGQEHTGKILGIDAGGTFTDIVLLSENGLQVEDYVKVPTVRGDMCLTIEAGLRSLLCAVSPEQITSVCLASTFATNALVENKRRPTALVLVGYDPVRVADAKRRGLFPTETIITVKGGHDCKGNAKAPLDLQLLREALPLVLSTVDSVAVSSFFSIRNPEHEMAVRDLIAILSPKTYVTCGHDISMELDAMLRAQTTALNANLIPIVMELFGAVETIFRKERITAPISVVKSDGSLVGIEWAKQRPIETILSGPAASAVGAGHLTKSNALGNPSWIIDMGGTTTDIIRLAANGMPVLKDEGAIVGGHKTLIKAIDVYTFGLGGDSRVAIDENGAICVGPKRVLPLCSYFAEKNAGLHAGRESLKTAKDPTAVIGINGQKKPHDQDELQITNMLEAQPLPVFVDELAENSRYPNIIKRRIYKMADKDMVALSGFTPTDMLNVIGKASKWNTEASMLGARVLADSENINDFCCAVYSKIISEISFNILYKTFVQNNIDIKENEDARSLVYLGIDYSDKMKKLHFDLNETLIAAGAPTWAFIKEVSDVLGCEYILPQFSEVAGAIGAAIGTFVLEHKILITGQNTGGLFRVHLPTGVADCDSLEGAVDKTIESMTPWLRERSMKAGAISPVINFERHDEILSAAGQKVYLWTEITFRVVDDQNKRININS